jgi:hypothetical protein
VASKQSFRIDFRDRIQHERKTCETVTFDYGIPAELFMGQRKGGPRQLRYRRFATAAEAIRFAVEELPAVRALGAWMQVGDQRFDGDDIQRLYESNDYPLQRRPSD